MGGNIQLDVQRKRKLSSPGSADVDDTHRPPQPPIPAWVERTPSAVEACHVIVDGRVAVKAEVDRGFTRSRHKLALLPYSDKFEKWLDDQFTYLETGMIASVLVGEPTPALHNYMVYLSEYIERFGQRFTREQHLRMIKFLYLIFTKENQWHEVVHLCAQVLEKIIGSSRLNHRDITLDWRPVYDVYYQAKYGKLEDVDGDKISGAVFKLKRFYPLPSVPEIWEEMQIHLSPRYTNKKFCDLCVRFLPVDMTGEEHKKYGAGLWWDTLWPIYTMVEMGRFWGEDLPSLFASVAYYAPEFMDWSPLYEDVFTRILRGMGLSLRMGKIQVGDGSGMASMDSFARWVADWIGGPKGCQPQLTRLMHCLEAFLHPSNNGDHTNVILIFMGTLSERMMDRYYHERIKKHKRNVPKEYYLSDKDISDFVSCLLQASLTALYNGDDYKLSSKILMSLASLEPGMVVPKFLEHTYPALNAVCEPHRLTQTLDCLVEIIYQIAADNKPDRNKSLIEKDLVPEIEKFRTVSTHRGLAQSSKDRFSCSQKLLTLRHHLIYLLEALTLAIDINDVEKTTLSLTNIILIFHLIPNVDSSPCVKIFKDLTEDEKQLCMLTARLPEMSNIIMDKMLHIIQSLAVCAPKDSVNLLGGLKDESTKTGDDEKQLKKVIDRCVSVLLSNSSAEIAKSLINKIFNCVKTNQFESLIATEMITGVVAQTVYARPETWSMFAEFVLKNLKIVLTPEARRSKDLNSTALWYVSLASGLFCTTSEAYVKNKATSFEILSLLTDCQCKTAHETGAIGLWYALYMLSRIYPMQQHFLSDQLNRPLDKWVPVREWAMTYQEHEVKLVWHVPDESRRDVIREMLEHFVFPLMERIKDPSLDVFALRRCLNQVYVAICGAIPALPLPKSAYAEPIHPGFSVLPSAKRGPTGITNKYWDIPYKDGSNVRETLVGIMEEIVERLGKTGDDSQALSTIATMLRTIIDDKGVDAGEQASVAQQTTEIFGFLADPTQFGKKVTMNAIESFMYSTHLSQVCREQTLPYTDFHERVFKILLRLALNDYPEVRAAAQTELKPLLQEHPQARETFVDIVAPVLEDASCSDERLKGALTLIQENKWASCSSSRIRLKLWQALVNMKTVDRPIFSDLLDAIWGQIGKIASPDRKAMVPGELEQFAQKRWDELPKTGPWVSMASREAITALTEKRNARRVQKQKENDHLVSILLALHRDKDLHHKRTKLCRTMIWRCQRHKANAETISVLLSRFADDEEYLRDRCADELSFWLKRNKPKTFRMDWECPQRPANTPFLLCGIRSDNLIMAYDSKNLPDTEEKWNRMVFFSKQYGCYKWPKKIKVNLYASEPQLDRQPLSPAEENIVEWFENMRNIERWVSLLLIEKRDDNSMNDNTWWMVKYLLRNFPDSDKIFNNITGVLKDLLKSKDRAGQRLAAEFFVGVAKGTKYRSFKVLDNLWKWLAPAVDKLFDVLNSEADAVWMSTVSKILSREDPRRFWWLIEQLLAGMQRPAPSAWHQAVRSDVINAVRWRDTETRKRICEIAWQQLPTAIIEIQRIGVSTALKHICTVYDANLYNDCLGLPERFHLRGIDYWLNRFTTKMETVLIPSLPVSSRSEPSMLDLAAKAAKAVPLAPPESSPKPKPPKASPRPLVRQRSDSNFKISADELRERQSNVYLRTLLEFLLQYYEECMTCLSPGIIHLFPMLVDYANEDCNEEQAAFKDVDIKQYASMLVHEYMSSLLLVEKYADEFLTTICQTFDRTYLWRVKVSVLKYLQVVVFSNIYVCEVPKRVQMVTNTIFNGLVDVQNEVRQEAARCFQTLVHFRYIKLDAALVERLEKLYQNSNRCQQHGAVLGFGGVVMAHPYTTPPAIVPVLGALCRVSSKNADMQTAATSALREFRRSHREDWPKTSQLLGPSLVYQIENAIAPNYYA